MAKAPDRKRVSYRCDFEMTATATDPPFIFNLEGIDEITIEASTLAIAWVTSTLTFQVSNNPGRGSWNAPPTGAVTLSAAGVTAPISVTAFRWGRIYASAAAASSFRARVDIYGEGGS